MKIIVLIPSLLMAIHGCKTSSQSSEKSLPIADIGDLSLEQWTAACQQELDNPTTAAQALKDLNELAGTRDCSAAYPMIKKVVKDAFPTPS